MAWDVTVPDIYAEFHRPDSQRSLLRLLTRQQRTSKYGALSASHIFFPMAVQIAGTWNQSTIELIQEIGRRVTAATEVTRETLFLFQRLSIVAL